MPLGPKNAPETLQRAIVVVIASVKSQFSLVYLDDLVIFPNSPDDDIHHVRSILTLLRNAGVTFKPRKFTSFHQTIDYVGHLTRQGSLKVTEKGTAAINNFKPTRNVTELPSLLELCNFLRRLVPNFAGIFAHLNKKLWKSQPMELDDLKKDELSALEKLRENWYLHQNRLYPVRKRNKPSEPATEKSDA